MLLCEEVVRDERTRQCVLVVCDMTEVGDVCVFCVFEFVLQTSTHMINTTTLRSGEEDSTRHVV